MKKNKWRELYDSYSEQFKATLSWDDFMMMPEVVRVNLIPLTTDEMQREYPDLPFDKEDYGDESKEFREICEKQSAVLKQFKEAYAKFPSWFRDYMPLGDFLATPEPYRTNIAKLTEKEFMLEFMDVYEDSLTDI